MSNLIDDVIQSCIMQTHIYSKTSFDNAKDASELLTAAQKSSEVLIGAIKYKLEERIEQLLLERIEKACDSGEWIVKIGDRLYRIGEY